MRFTMLPTIAEAALEQLAASGEEAVARERYAHYYAVLVNTERAKHQGAGETIMVNHLEQELDNIRYTLTWLLQHDIAQAAQLVHAAARFWRIRGHFSEGINWGNAVLEREAQLEPLLVNRVLRTVGSLYAEMGYLDEAYPYHERSFELSSQMDSKPDMLIALHNMCSTAAVRDDRATAEQIVEQIRTLAAETGSDRLLAQALTTVGQINMMHQRLPTDDDIAMIEAGLAVTRQAGNKGIVARDLANLGEAKRLIGDCPAARQHYSEALLLCAEIGYQLGVAELLNEVAALLLAEAGHHDAAAASCLLAACRTALSVADFDAAWQQGSAMSMAEAVEYALQTSVPSPANHTPYSAPSTPPPHAPAGG